MKVVLFVMGGYSAKHMAGASELKTYAMFLGRDCWCLTLDEWAQMV